MKIIINSKDSKLTGAEESIIRNKINLFSKVLKRFSPEQKKANIRIEKGSRWGYKMSFSMWLPKKKHIFAEVKGKNLPAATDKLKDQVERQITDYKDKLAENRIEKDLILKKLK